MFQSLKTKMKTILKLSIVILLITNLSAYAQTFSFVRTDPPIVYAPIGTVEIKNHGTITNLTGSSFAITFRATYNLPSGWGAGYCSWEACYGPLQDSITTNGCPPGQNIFYVYFWPDTTVRGTGFVTITAKKTSNPTESYTVVFGASTEPVGVKQIGTVVESFRLNQNYPNPFNPVTKIDFSIAKSDYVDLRVYDILGREVKVLLSQFMTPGEYEYEFEAFNLASGMYYYRLKSGENVAVKKMTLVK